MNRVDDVRQRIVKSGLMSEADFDDAVNEWQTALLDASSPDDGSGLLAWLVRRQRLTEFQAEAILAGHTGPFMLGPYRVYEHIAAGRHGHVFRAVHEAFDQPVSLKVFPSLLTDDLELLARIQREARISVQLDSPFVLQTFQIGRAGKVHYLACEDLQGETLENRLNREGAFSCAEACSLMRQAALGLAHLHDHGIVHRDVQPATIWIADQGRLKLFEFGAARDALGFLDLGLDSSNQVTGTISSPVVGTFAYLAPEQSADPRSADARSDLYGLGCTLYHCLTGAPPFAESNPLKLIDAHAHQVPTPINQFDADLPLELSELVARLLEKQRNNRCATAIEVAEALEAFVDPEELVAEALVSRPEISAAFKQWLQLQPQTAEDRTGAAQATAPSTTSESSFWNWMAKKKQP